MLCATQHTQTVPKNEFCRLFVKAGLFSALYNVIRRVRCVVFAAARHIVVAGGGGVDGSPTSHGSASPLGEDDIAGAGAGVHAAATAGESKAARLARVVALGSVSVTALLAHAAPANDSSATLDGSIAWGSGASTPTAAASAAGSASAAATSLPQLSTERSEAAVVSQALTDLALAADVVVTFAQNQSLMRTSMAEHELLLGKPAMGSPPP